MILKHIHFFKSSYSILQCDPLSKTSTSTYSLPNLMDHPIRSPIACYSRDKRTMEKLSKQMQRVRSTSSFVQREADGLTMETGWEERAAAAAASRSQERETRPRSRCCRRRRRRPSRDLHAARRPLSRWLLPFSPALCSFSFQSPAPFLCVHRTVVRTRKQALWPPPRIVESRNWVSRWRVIMLFMSTGMWRDSEEKVSTDAPGNIYRSSDTVPNPRFRIFPTGRVLYGRLIHFAFDPQPIATPLWQATNEELVMCVFQLLEPNLRFFLLSFTFLLFFLKFCFSITFYLRHSLRFHLHGVSPSNVLVFVSFFSFFLLFYSNRHEEIQGDPTKIL